MQRFAVIGHPIAHSRSPDIHQAFAKQFNIDLEYGRIDAAPDNFQSNVMAFLKSGGRGLNVTVPHKESAFQLCHSLSSFAKAAQAVNTLTFAADGTLTGDNTDGRGLVRALKEHHQVILSERRILIIGAGGATRGILEPFIQAGVSSITLANRSQDKALRLAEAFKHKITCHVIGLDASLSTRPDIIVHASSAGLSGEIVAGSKDWYTPETICVDLGYGKGLTSYLRHTQSLGCQHLIDGLGMLVEQAAISFESWHGKKPQTTVVLNQLRTSLM
jgi:shikimate dehydrogenase